MKTSKFQIAFLAGVMALGLSACKKEPAELGSEGDNKNVLASMGVGKDWGDNANCSPQGCPSTNQSGGVRDNRGTAATWLFKPEHLGLVFLSFGDAGQIKASHALYPRAECLGEHGLNAHQVILKSYESTGAWLSTPGQCEIFPGGSGDNFDNFNFFDVTEIFIKTDGKNVSFNKQHPVIFTPYSPGERNRGQELEENYSFYAATTDPDSSGDDKLLRLENWFAYDPTPDNGQASFKPLPPSSPANLRSNSDRRKWRDYSMNIHLVATPVVVTPEDPPKKPLDIIIDPDTGNGSDGTGPFDEDKEKGNGKD
jgi:hypothetical protein